MPQQDHRAEGVVRRETRGDLFLARGRLEQEGRLPQGHRHASEALRLKPDIAIYNLRGSAYYDKGEYDIAISDFNDALRLGLAHIPDQAAPRGKVALRIIARGEPLAKPA